MKITKSSKSILLTLSSKEIEAIVKNVVLGNSKVKLLKSAQTTQISEHGLDYLDAWLNALTKKIWAFNEQVNAQKNTAKEFLNKYPEYGKGILPLINALQTNINTTVNNFVEQVNAHEPKADQSPASQEKQPVTQPATQATPTKTPYTKQQLAKIGEDFLKSEEGLRYIEYINKNFKNPKEISDFRFALKNAIKQNEGKPTYQSKLNAVLKWFVDNKINKINPAVPNTIPTKGLVEDVSKAVSNAKENKGVPATKTPSRHEGRGGNPANKGRFSPRVPAAQPVASNNYLNNKLSIVLAKLKK